MDRNEDFDIHITLRFRQEPSVAAAAAGPVPQVAIHGPFIVPNRSRAPIAPLDALVDTTYPFSATGLLLIRAVIPLADQLARHVRQAGAIPVVVPVCDAHLASGQRKEELCMPAIAFEEEPRVLESATPQLAAPEPSLTQDGSAWIFELGFDDGERGVDTSRSVSATRKSTLGVHADTDASRASSDGVEEVVVVERVVRQNFVKLSPTPDVEASSGADVGAQDAPLCQDQRAFPVDAPCAQTHPSLTCHAGVHEAHGAASLPGPIAIGGKGTVVVPIPALPSITQWKVAVPELKTLVAHTVAIAVPRAVTVSRPPSASPELAIPVLLTITIAVAVAVKISRAVTRSCAVSVQFTEITAALRAALVFPALALVAARVAPALSRRTGPVAVDAAPSSDVVVVHIVAPHHAVHVARAEVAARVALTIPVSELIGPPALIPTRRPIFLVLNLPLSMADATEAITASLHTYAIDDGVVDYIDHVLLPHKTSAYAYLTTGIHFPSALVLDGLQIDGFPGPIRCERHL
ncbi:hypothetical protein GGF32_009564 [Allomyces javanicus]|nr:hypothetical protein GGF32_009564 [Allomyces javanicus]